MIFTNIILLNDLAVLCIEKLCPKNIEKWTPSFGVSKHCSIWLKVCSLINLIMLNSFFMLLFLLQKSFFWTFFSKRLRYKFVRNLGQLPELFIGSAVSWKIIIFGCFDHLLLVKSTLLVVTKWCVRPFLATSCQSAEVPWSYFLSIIMVYSWK